MDSNFASQAGNYDRSRAIADPAPEAIEASDAGTLVAPVTSCRSQFAECGGGS